MAFAKIASCVGNAAQQNFNEICKLMHGEIFHTLYSLLIDFLFFAHNKVYEGEKGKCFDTTVNPVFEEPKEMLSG